MGCYTSKHQDSTVTANDRVVGATGLNVKMGVGEAASASDQGKIGSNTAGDRQEGGGEAATGQNGLASTAKEELEAADEKLLNLLQQTSDGFGQGIQVNQWASGYAPAGERASGLL